MKVVDSQKQVRNDTGDVRVKQSVEVAAPAKGHEAQQVDSKQVTHSCTQHNLYLYSTLDCS